MKPKSFSYVGVVFALAIIVGIGCTKKSSYTRNMPPPYPGPYIIYDFSVYVFYPSIYNIFVGDMISFRANERYTDSLWWDFGDGSKDTGLLAYHVYKDTGLFYVTLHIDEDSTSDVKKPIYIYNAPDSLSVSKMTGIRNWHGYKKAVTTFVTSELLDTFGIEVINRGAIKIKKDTLRYNGTDNGIFYYSMSVGINGGWDFYYYYKGDSMHAVYYNTANGRPDSQTINHFHTP